MKQSLTNPRHQDEKRQEHTNQDIRRQPLSAHSGPQANTETPGRYAW